MIRDTVIKKELFNYVNDVVSQHAKWDGDQYVVNWKRLPEDDRNHIIAIMVDLDGKDFYAICENDEKYRDDILAKMVGMMKRDDMDSELDFVYSVKEAINAYYEDKAIEYVDEVAGEYTHDTLRESGLHYVQDRNHGDFVIQRI